LWIGSGNKASPSRFMVLLFCDVDVFDSSAVPSRWPCVRDNNGRNLLATHLCAGYFLPSPDTILRIPTSDSPVPEIQASWLMKSTTTVHRRLLHNNFPFFFKMFSRISWYDYKLSTTRVVYQVYRRITISTTRPCLSMSSVNFTVPSVGKGRSVKRPKSPNISQTGFGASTTVCYSTIQVLAPITKHTLRDGLYYIQYSTSSFFFFYIISLLLEYCTCTTTGSIRMSFSCELPLRYIILPYR
jgi:hypothetical protein